MATRIVTKSGSGAPTTDDLIAGELAVDLTNGRLYTEDSGGTVLELGLNPNGNVNVTGSVTASADITISNGNNRFVASSTSSGDYVRMYGGGGTGKWDIYGNGANLRIGDNESAGLVQIDTDLYTVGNVGIGVSPTLPLSVDGDIWQGNTSGVEIGRITNAAGWYDFGGSSNVNGAQMSHASTLRFVTNTAEAMRIDSSGNVGIGCSPSAPLNISATYASDTTEQFRIQDNTGGALDFYGYANATRAIQALDSTNDAPKDLLLNPLGGNVGIGTSSPASPTGFGSSGILHLKGATGNDCSIVLEGLSGSGGRQEIGASGGALQFYRGAATGSMTESMRIDASGTVKISHADTASEGLRVIQTTAARTSGGALGVFYDDQAGTTQPTLKVIQNGTGDILQLFDGASQVVTVTDGGNLLVGKTSTSFSTAGSRLTPDGGGQFIVSGGAGVEINRLSSDGTLLGLYKDGTTVGSIGTTGGKLYIGSQDGSDAFLRFESNEISPCAHEGSFRDNVINLGKSASRFKDLYLSGTAKSQAVELEDIKAKDTSGLNLQTSDGQKRVILDNSGNLLVGTTTSHGRLAIGDFSATGADYGVAFVDGSDVYFVRSSTNISSSSAHYQFYNTNGNVGSITTSASATAYNTSSDQRLKENIADADDAGSKIDAIQVRKFDWKVDGSHQDYGMVAQELNTVAPEAVSAPEDPEEMMGVDYSKLVPMMLKEIQSLRARIAALES